jgi:uncharacterized coiled-coil protein SlyX
MAKPLPNPVALRLDELANEVRALRAAVEAMGGGGQVSASHQPDPAPVDLTPILEAIAGTSAIAEAARLEANAAHQHAAALREELAGVARQVAEQERTIAGLSDQLRAFVAPLTELTIKTSTIGITPDQLAALNAVHVKAIDIAKAT